MKKQFTKKEDEILDIELFNLFRDIYPDSESTEKAIREARKACSFLKKQNLQFDLDADFSNDLDN
jgi:hypothetical protein